MLEGVEGVEGLVSIFHLYQPSIRYCMEYCSHIWLAYVYLVGRMSSADIPKCMRNFQ